MFHVILRQFYLIWPSLQSQSNSLSQAPQFFFRMEGADLCIEIVKRATSGFVYSEAVAR